MYDNWTDEEITEEITKKYGDGWSIKTLNAEDPLCIEYFKRLETGE